MGYQIAFVFPLVDVVVSAERLHILQGCNRSVSHKIPMRILYRFHARWGVAQKEKKAKTSSKLVSSWKCTHSHWWAVGTVIVFGLHLMSICDDEPVNESTVLLRSNGSKTYSKYNHSYRNCEVLLSTFIWATVHVDRIALSDFTDRDSVT